MEPSSSLNELWTLRGVTPETRRRFVEMAKAKHTNVGTLANEVLSAAIESFLRRPSPTRIEATSERPNIHLSEISRRLAAIESLLELGRVDPVPIEYDESEVDEDDLFVHLLRSVDHLSSDVPLSPRDKVGLVSLLEQTRDPRVALAEMLVFIARQIARRIDDPRLHLRIEVAARQSSRPAPDLPMITARHRPDKPE
jgi:hypothetical protein